MKKYFLVYENTIQEMLSWRFSIFMWRLRHVLNLLILYYLWSSVFSRNTVFGDYTFPVMMTYILVSSIASNFALTTGAQAVSDQIVNGDLINYIMKPYSFFKHFFAKEMAGKSLNVFFETIEVVLLFLILSPPLIQPSLANFLLFALFILLGLTIALHLDLLVSFLAFWTTETWAPRFTYGIIVMFLGGVYFPLDILPAPFYNALLLTPFPYMYYFPVKMYLGDPLSPTIILGTFSWLILSYFLTHLVWRIGLHNYSFAGKA